MNAAIKTDFLQTIRNPRPDRSNPTNSSSRDGGRFHPRAMLEVS
jgi:hypothetical protein